MKRSKKGDVVFGMAYQIDRKREPFTLVVHGHFLLWHMLLLFCAQNLSTTADDDDREVCALASKK